MKAVLVHRERLDLDDGSIVEMVLWRVPEPVAGSRHSYKYRLYFGREGVRLVGYDNERGKGDHKHLGLREEPYRFVSPRQLMDDFMRDVKGSRR